MKKKRYISFLVILISSWLLLVSSYTVDVNAESWLWPVTGGKVGHPFNCTFCTTHNGNHNGIDINGIPSGAPVMAIAAGKITCVNNFQSGIATCPTCDMTGGGYHVEIYHGNNMYSNYCHLSGTKVAIGSTVSQGEVIGYVGDTGNSFGAHLHLSMAYTTGSHLFWSSPQFKDPSAYISPSSSTGITLTNGAVTNISNTDAKISSTLSPLSYVTTCGFYIGTSPSALSKVTETINGNVNSIWYNLAADWKPLSQGTQYYYKFYAVINGVEHQSTLSSFTTTGQAKPTFASISISKNQILVGEKVTFTFSSNNSPSYTIGIDKGTTRIDTNICTSGYTRSFSEPGSYSAYVTASNSAGLIDSARVYFTVSVPVAGVTLNTATTTINGIGVMEKLVGTIAPSDATNQKINWSSSNTGVATVDTAGKVTSKGYGTAVITATTEDGAKGATCTVTVKSQKNYSGTYNIKSIRSGLVMDVNGGGKTEGTNIIQWTANGGLNQQWKFETLGNGYYKITSVLNPAYSLDVNGGGAANGTRVIQWTYHGGINQQWKIIENADGSISLMSRLSAESGTRSVLDVNGGGTKAGVNIIQWTSNGLDNQKWSLVPVAEDYSGIYTIKSKKSGLVMDVNGGGKTEGTNIIQWSANGGLNQQWKFESLGNGYYKITSALNPTYSLDVFGGGTTIGTRVIQWTYRGAANQQWKIIKNTDGSVSFMSRLAVESGTRYVLDVNGGGTTPGVNVIQWTNNGLDNQKWNLAAIN